MGRKRFHTPLRVLLNNRLVGYLVKDPGGAIDFRYDESWLAWEHALPVSLSLPLREDAYRGEPVAAVFENLLPDSENLRRRVAEKVGASGTDSYSLLSQIGRDCVGALQFLPEGEEAISDTAGAIAGKVISDDAIEALLKNLAQAPLGLHRDQEFRISVAGRRRRRPFSSMRASGGNPTERRRPPISSKRKWVRCPTGSISPTALKMNIIVCNSWRLSVCR